MFCCTLCYVQSSFAIILMGKRELVALLSLSSWCLVMVVWLFLVVSWVSLRFVIVVFPDHTPWLFLYYTSISSNIIVVYYNGEFRVMWYAITLVVQRCLHDLRGPCREMVGHLFPCSSEINWLVPFFPQIENYVSYVPCPRNVLCSP